jgi:hypothetical protein
MPANLQGSVVSGDRHDTTIAGAEIQLTPYD